jgi:6-pyruvoyltetrahydropterin/6-carboxytetrahydropterin synthase
MPTVNANFQVTVSKDYLSFSSAHFITLRGHKCESLHGHNYRVGVTVTGQVDPECQFVLDFALLKEILRPMVDAIDHKVLLPTASPKLTLDESGDRLTVIYLGARWPSISPCRCGPRSPGVVSTTWRNWRSR